MLGNCPRVADDSGRPAKNGEAQPSNSRGGKYVTNSGVWCTRVVTPMDITTKIRTIPDYPKPGIAFRDITTLLADRDGFAYVVNQLVARYRSSAIDKVAAIESRGFILGAPLAAGIGAGFVPVRKKGKLPSDVIGLDYDLEYGVDRLEIHVDAVKPGERILIVDDLVATGGTALAASQLVRKLQGEIVECCFVVDLPELKGRKKLEGAGITTFALCSFDGH